LKHVGASGLSGTDRGLVGARGECHRENERAACAKKMCHGHLNLPA
jgi:hypothetical protein